MKGEFLNATFSKPREMSEVEKAKADMDYHRRMWHAFAYRDAKRHYERLLNRERRNKDAGAD